MLSVRAIGRRMLPLARWYAAADAAAAKQSTATSDDLRLTLASPNNVIFSDVVVKQVDVSTLSGSMGILPKHVPVVGMLQPGVVCVIDNEGKQIKYFASSGTVAMNPDGSCQVLAEEIAKLEDIDVATAEQELRAAQQKAQEASNDTERVTAQIEVTTFEALIRAAHDVEK